MNRLDEHDRKFSTAKAPPDPETLAIFEARRNAFSEPRRRMDRAKYMFAELCDRATNTHGPGFLRKGSVVVPDSELARKFGVWESTIYTWKRQLQVCGYIWIEKQWRSDRWPITVYHLACIHPRRNGATQNPDGTSNAGKRSAPGKVGEPTGNIDPETGQPKVWSQGARKPGQKSLPLATPHVTPVPWNDPSKKRKKLDLRAIVAAAKPSDWLSATAGTGCEPRAIVADSHGGHRLTATAERGSQPRPNGAESHKVNGRTATNGEGHKRVSVGSLSHSESKGEGEHPPDFEFGEWKSGLKELFPSRLNAMKAELQAKLGIERDAERRAFYKRRIEAIDEVRLGGKPPKPSPLAAKPRAVKTAAAEKPLTAEQLLEGARYLVSVGDEGKLTTAQRAAYDRAEKAER